MHFYVCNNVIFLGLSVYDCAIRSDSTLIICDAVRLHKSLKELILKCHLDWEKYGEDTAFDHGSFSSIPPGSAALLNLNDISGSMYTIQHNKRRRDQ